MRSRSILRAPQWPDLSALLRLSAAALVFGLAVLAAWGPRATLSDPVYRYLFVLDITQSMNAADYHHSGYPSDRLGFAKAAIRETLEELPCGSEVGIGLFTTQQILIVFQGLEVCEHLPAMADVLEHIDWRMAWSADSHIAQGLFAALRKTAALPERTALVFLTDGNQTPPLPSRPNYSGKPGEVPGLVVGVGGLSSVPIPKLDRNNRQTGFWLQGDIDVGPESDYTVQRGVGDTVKRQAMQADDPPLLSAVDESELKTLAGLTGLAYLHLRDPDDLRHRLSDRSFGEIRPVRVNVAWPCAAVALLIWLASFVRSVLPHSPTARS